MHISNDTLSRQRRRSVFRYFWSCAIHHDIVYKHSHLSQPLGRPDPRVSARYSMLCPCLTWPLPAEPSGWLHYQYNPTCEPAITYLVFDASNIGTVNVINQLALVSLQYLNAAFALNYTHVPGVLGGEHPDIWVTNADCLKACGR